jgi:hypothetical protein
VTYVLAGYAATVLGLGSYAGWLLRRARGLERLRREA